MNASSDAFGGAPSVPAPAVLAAALPPHVREVIAHLAARGHETVAVGGGVRDALLGRPVRGLWDLATAATPPQVIALFPSAIPTGVEHGTVTLPHAAGAIEVTSYRTDIGASDARHPDRVEFGVSLAGDLARRDFTVNALAYDPGRELLVDSTGGRADLAARLLRAVGDPVARFREDALRPLRAARLAAVLEFEVEPATRDALGAVADLVPRLSQERVRDEVGRMLLAPSPSVGFALLRDSGLLPLLLPELAACVGVTQNRHHAFDVYEHTVRAVDAAPPEPRLRWAALAHDLGKPATRVALADGEATFHGHPQVGGDIVDRMLERLRLPRDERTAIVLLVREHLFDYRAEWTDAAVRRFVRRVGIEALPALFALRRADAAATRPEAPDLAALDAFVARLAVVLAPQPPLAVRDLAVDGGDVLRILEVSPGPAVGRALARLLEEALDDPATNQRVHQLARLEDLARETRGGSAGGSS